MNPVRILAVVVYLLVSTANGFAQSRATFEVASIKPSAGSANSRAGFQPGGRFVATNASARELIRLAYGHAGSLDPSRLIGGPGWLDTDRFDVNAIAGDNLPPQIVLEMLQSLLADRFKLALHPETRTLPVYVLSVAKVDRTLGPRLRQTLDCTTGSGDSALPKAASCGGGGRDGHLEFGGVPLSMVIDTPALLREVRRPIVDRTGLTGAYEGTLDWTPASAAGGQGAFDLSPAPLPDGASIFTAIQEQLGLKLTPGTGPVEVFVIDTVQRLLPD